MNFTESDTSNTGTEIKSMTAITENWIAITTLSRQNLKLPVAISTFLMAITTLLMLNTN